MKAMYKSELACAAGVSLRTLTRWLKDPFINTQLTEMGESPHCKMFSPRAVKFICNHFDIEL